MVKEKISAVAKDVTNLIGTYTKLFEKEKTGRQIIDAYRTADGFDVITVIKNPFGSYDLCGIERLSNDDYVYIPEDEDELGEGFEKREITLLF